MAKLAICDIFYATYAVAFTNHTYLREEIRLLFDCVDFVFFCIYIEKTITHISAYIYA